MTTTNGAVNACLDYGELIFNPGESNETSMHTPAWTILDLSPLWMPPQVRGTNVTLPGTPGRRPYPLRFDQTDYDLEMVISGAVDRHGALWPDPIMGLYENLLYLSENVVEPMTPPLATRPAELVAPDGSTLLTADVQVLSLERGTTTDEIMQAVLIIRIPAGGFVEGSS